MLRDGLTFHHCMSRGEASVIAIPRRFLRLRSSNMQLIVTQLHTATVDGSTGPERAGKLPQVVPAHRFQLEVE